LILPDLSFEYPLWKDGITAAGLDEAGRGAWAGPVYAGAVILPLDPAVQSSLVGVRDSKLMTPRQREYWVEKIKDAALTWGVGFASHQEIDALGILPATRLAMQRALAALSMEPGHLLIDAVRLKEVALPQTSIIKGDSRSLSIAAASVLGKTARDELMRSMEERFPGYDFFHNKGYGTARHRQALEALKVCSIHRRSFAPIRMILDAGCLSSPSD